MQYENKNRKKGKKRIIKKVLKYIKSIFVSLIITFACIILFAFIIKWASLSDKVIAPVNLVIKGISVFAGVLMLTKGGEKGLFKGLIFAVVYTLISFTIFSSLAGNFVLGLGIVADFGFNAVVGILSGILGVNIKKSAK